MIEKKTGNEAMNLDITRFQEPKQVQRAARSQAGSKSQAGFMNCPYAVQHFCYRNTIAFEIPTLQLLSSRTLLAHKARFGQNCFFGSLPLPCLEWIDISSYLPRKSWYSLMCWNTSLAKTGQQTNLEYNFLWQKIEDGAHFSSCVFGQRELRSQSLILERELQYQW